MRFSQRAATYDLHAGPQRVFARRVAEFIGSPPPAAVLELGAGTGALTHWLAARGFSVTATDVAPAMLERGRRAVPAAAWSTLDAFYGQLPASDLQVSSGLLQWAEDPVPVLAAWAAALQPGGRMVHAFPCDPCLHEWRSVSGHSPIVWRDEAAWKAIFGRAGLAVNRSELWIERVVFDSALAMVRAMHGSGITGRAVLNPGQLRRALRDYERLFRRNQGVVATWAWLAVEAASSAKV